ncbi:MAG: hypothetical protein ACD_46C00682G0003 [uncultured bacterium]|nr:MAG: hypothetical protein ACD_46C00682G0003 [uncultured bacterium]
MNNQLWKYFFIVGLSTLLLSSCQENISYSYLMQHPLIAQEELEKCKAAEHQTAEDIERCKIILDATENINSILAEQQADAEKFGQRILELQNEVTKLKTSIQALQQQLKAQQTTSLQTQLNQLQKTYTEKQENLNIMLAIVGMNSPE